MIPAPRTNVSSLRPRPKPYDWLDDADLGVTLTNYDAALILAALNVHETRQVRDVARKLRRKLTADGYVCNGAAAVWQEVGA